MSFQQPLKQSSQRHNKALHRTRLRLPVGEPRRGCKANPLGNKQNMIRLNQMNVADFEIFKTRTIQSYALDIVDSRGLSEEEALKNSESETNKILSKGLETSNHTFLNILKTDSNENIGHIWYQTEMNDSEVFIYHIEIKEECRGNGYGKMAMIELASLVKQDGVSRVRLNVFSNNRVAHSLYKKLGYRVTNLQMQKDI